MTICDVIYCDNVAETRGLCYRHYREFLRTRDPDDDLRTVDHANEPTYCTCDDPWPSPNGECRSCRRLIEGAHP